MIGNFEERIADSMKVVSFGVVGTEAVADNVLVEAVISTEDESALVEESEKEPTAVVHEEKALSGSAISFLKGLNDD